MIPSELDSTMSLTHSDVESSFINVIRSGDATNIRVFLQSTFSFLAEKNPFLNKTQNIEGALDNLVKTYTVIGQLISVPFAVVNITNGTRSVINSTFADILNMICEHDVHQNVDMGNGKTCSCSFHTEPLMAHLVYASLIAGIYAIETTEPSESSEKIVLMAVFSALMHDIGKPACVKAFGKHIGYPLHGEIGSMMFLRAFNDNMSEFFTRNQWESMAQVINVHMCSYHVTEFSDDWNQERVKSIAHAPLIVKRLLKLLSYGDTFGKFADETHDDTADADIFISTRQNWQRMIMTPLELDTNKLTIFLNGRSHSGKSIIANLLIDQMTAKGKTCSYISRDIIMCLLIWERYFKQLEKQGFSEPLPGERPTGALYGACYNLCHANNLGSLVNARMKKQISESIIKNDVTLIDTMTTLFPGIDRIIPADVSRTIRISLLCTANFETVLDDKNGVDAKKQLELTGEISLMSPMDLTGVDTSGIQSAYCNSTPPLAFAPQYVFPVVSTSDFQGAETMGLPTVIDFLDKIFEQIAHTPESNFINTNTLLIGNYIRHYDKKFSRDFDKLCAFFRTQAYTANSPYELRNHPEFKNMLFHLKYLEHNKIWYHWARGARGTGMMRMDNGIWKMIKMLLPRGAEVLTGYQVDRGITKTENMSTADIEPNLDKNYSSANLSTDQKELIMALYKKLPVDLVASFKKDGSLLAFGHYTGEVAKKLRAIINNVCDDFTKTVMQTWDKLTGHHNEVLLMMSQGTFWLAPDMQDYNTTALFPDACGQTPRLSPTEKIRTYGPALFARLRGLFSKLNGDHQIAIFETICKDRITDAGKEHTELAVSYPESSATFLSATELYHADDAPQEYIYIPHYKISDIIAEYGFVEPAFWEVKTTNAMDQLVCSVGDVIHGRLTVEGFYTRHPPANKHGYLSVIDYEGFVVYDVERNDSYSKIKTDEYYKGHKFHEENVPALIALADVAGHIFPLARRVKQVFESLIPACKDICTKLCQFIDTDDSLRACLSEKARLSLDKMKTKEAKYKLVINTCRQQIGIFGAELFQCYFPTLKNVSADKFDISTFVVSFAMQTKIWDEKIDGSVVIDDKSRNSFIAALFS